MLAEAEAPGVPLTCNEAAGFCDIGRRRRRWLNAPCRSRRQPNARLWRRRRHRLVWQRHWRQRTASSTSSWARRRRYHSCSCSQRLVGNKPSSCSGGGGSSGCSCSCCGSRLRSLVRRSQGVHYQDVDWYAESSESSNTAENAQRAQPAASDAASRELATLAGARCWREASS